MVAKGQGSKQNKVARLNFVDGKEARIRVANIPGGRVNHMNSLALGQRNTGCTRGGKGLYPKEAPDPSWLVPSGSGG